MGNGTFLCDVSIGGTIPFAKESAVRHWFSGVQAERLAIVHADAPFLASRYAQCDQLNLAHRFEVCPADAA